MYELMVENQIEGRGVRDPEVLAAMRVVPRAKFMPEDQRHKATWDGPLPIGHGATISQPYVVGAMSELLQVEPGDRVLDVGTGSGYQAAVLAQMGCEVWSVERVPELSARAGKLLDELGYDVKLRVGDGHQGWAEGAPYQGILVGAAPERVPDALLEQLAVGGRLVIPVGTGRHQELITLERTPTGFVRKRQFAVLFVPLVISIRGNV